MFPKLLFDFAHWLEGHDLKMDKVTGEVETDQPFLHMEKADWFQ